ncbi:MAG: serine/threonine protein kinase, partial [Candidatus Cloacimonetes bacterium]|nr:serine/threonine protein kinase [Candidatus Cloacimonadota bacterium]
MLIRQDSIVYDESGNEYIVEEFIGRGSLGDVYKIQRKSDSKSFALKTVQSPFVDESIIKSIINEGKLSENVKHNNVINYYYFHDGEKYPNLPLYIIMEYANEGTLDDLIDLKKESKEFFTNDELINMFIDLINGMEEINKYLIHRDIKPDNILIKNSVLKISDFGLSKIVTEATRTSTFKGVGCVPYLAPEGWKNYKNTILMDIYSMGFVFYKLACLEHPLKVEENTFQNWQEAHLFQVPISVEKINREVSPVISQLIMRMIEKDTHTRIQNWQEAREFIKKDSQPETNYSDLVKKILLKRREEEQKANEAQLKREKRQKEINEFKKSILFQLKKDIIKPLSEFIDEINNKSDRKKIIFNFNENTLTATIDALPNHIQISLQPIIEENFYREVK